MIRFHRQSLIAIAAAGVVMACISVYQCGKMQNHAAAQLRPTRQVSRPLGHLSATTFRSVGSECLGVLE